LRTSIGVQLDVSELKISKLIDEFAAARYYAQLLKNCDALTERPERSHAKALVGKN
jgi:hypothetical protein